MKRPRHQKKRQNHYCILINPKAAEYNFKHIRKLIEAIRKRGDVYSVFEANSPSELIKTAQKVSGIRRWGRSIPDNFTRRGKVTALIACGGDGTFNMTARSAVKANLPIGFMPMGKENSIARSLLGSTSIDTAVEKIMSQSYRLIDYAQAGEYPFFSSAGFKFTYKVARYLEKYSPPRFGIGWNKLGNRAAEEVDRNDMVIKIDSFRFELTPTMVQINLLPITHGLTFSDLSLNDDHLAEVIIDFGAGKKDFGSYLRSLYKKKYIYGSDIRIFRGKSISIEGMSGLPMYLDGEIIKPEGDVLDIIVQEKQLKVFC